MAHETKGDNPIQKETRREAYDRELAKMPRTERILLEVFQRNPNAEYCCFTMGDEVDIIQLTIRPALTKLSQKNYIAAVRKGPHPSARTSVTFYKLLQPALPGMEEK